MRKSRLFLRSGLQKMLPILMLLVIVGANHSNAQDFPQPPDLQQEDITLETAIELARQYNPGLLGFSLAEQELQAQALQAGRSLNPELGFGMDNFGGSGSHHGLSSAEYTLSLSQTFELGGKRDSQTESALWEVKGVRQESMMVGLQVENHVAEAFVATLKAQEEITLALKLVRLAEENLDFVRRRVAMGAVSSVEESQALVDVHSARLELETGRQARAIAKIRLSSLWNAPTPTFGRAKGSLESMCNLPAWEELTQRLPDCPSLQWWEIEEGKRRSAMVLARAMGTMDLTASAGVRHYQDSGEFAAVAGISIPLQVHNKNQDSRRAAQYKLDQLETEKQTQFLALRAELLEQFQTVSTSHGHIVSIRDEILPSAEKAMQQSEIAYRKGKFNMTDLLSVRRTWFQWQQNYVTALADYQIGIAQIHRILGDNHTEILISQENN